MTMDFDKFRVSDIINTLKSEIVGLDTPQGRQALDPYIIPDEKGRRDNVFVRRSALSAPVVVDIIMNHSPFSNQVAINNFFDGIDAAPVSKSAFSQKRTRLDPRYFKHLNSEFINWCYQKCGPIMKQWNGWYVLGCDGSDIALPDSDALAEVYGRYRYGTNSGQKGETFPMAKIIMVNDMCNGLTLYCSLNPYTANEHEALARMLPEIERTLPFAKERVIQIMDRGYFSLSNLRKLDRSGMRYVLRVPIVKGVVRHFIDSGVRESDIDWKPTCNTSLTKDKDWRAEGRNPIRVRLVRVDLPGGEVEVLATNLTADEVDAAKMKDLYFMRWPVEIDFLHYKYPFNIEGFSGARPVCVQQDVFAAVLDYNIVRQIENATKEDIAQDDRHRMLEHKTDIAVLVGCFFMCFTGLMVLDRTKECLGMMFWTARHNTVSVRGGRHFSRQRKRHTSSDKNRTQTNRKRVH